MGGVFDDNGESSPLLTETDPDAPAQVERPRQRPMEVDSMRYLETAGRVSVGIGADKMPLIGGEPPTGPEPGLTDTNLICNEAEGRPACEHYIALVLPADGVAKGFEELRQIRRFCKKLSTAAELFEITGNIYACTGRSPEDLVSIRIVKDFERRQKEIAAEHAETSGTLDF